MLLRMIVMTLAVCLVFFVAGKRARTDQLAVLIGCSLGVALIVPLGIARDKMEGTMDFICGLPVEPWDIALSRFAAVVALALPWAVGIGAMSIGATAIGRLNPFDVAVVAWFALSLLGTCATALFSRFDFETLLGAPMIVMVVVLVVVPRAVRFWLPDLTAASVLRALAQPMAPALLVGGAVLTAVVLGGVAFGMTVRGFATYRRDPARN